MRSNWNRCFRPAAKPAELEIVHDAMVPAGHLAYARQQNPLGLGHAFWCARQMVAGEPFAVLLPDDLVQARTGVPGTDDRGL